MLCSRMHGLLLWEGKLHPECVEGEAQNHHCCPYHKNPPYAVIHAVTHAVESVDRSLYCTHGAELCRPVRRTQVHSTDFLQDQRSHIRTYRRNAQDRIRVGDATSHVHVHMYKASHMHKATLCGFLQQRSPSRGRRKMCIDDSIWWELLSSSDFVTCWPTAGKAVHLITGCFRDRCVRAVFVRA